MLPPSCDDSDTATTQAALQAMLHGEEDYSCHRCYLLVAVLGLESWSRVNLGDIHLALATDVHAVLFNLREVQDCRTKPGQPGVFRAAEAIQ